MRDLDAVYAVEGKREVPPALQNEEGINSKTPAVPIGTAGFSIALPQWITAGGHTMTSQYIQGVQIDFRRAVEGPEDRQLGTAQHRAVASQFLPHGPVNGDKVLRCASPAPLDLIVDDGR